MLLPFTAIAKKQFECERLRELHAALRCTDNAWREARATGAEYDAVVALCRLHIDASYKYQRARWGRVRARLNAPGLMR